MVLGPLEPEYDKAQIIAAIKGGTAWSGLISSLVGINFLQMGSLALLPVSPKAFWRFNRACADSWWSWCVQTIHALHGTDIVVTGHDVPKGENAVITVNHQEMPDITALMALARRKERLGDLKFFVKDAIKWVPGVGWGMLFLNMVFLKREWHKDKASIEKTFRTIKQRKVPAWLVIFVEGTRITASKLERSNAFAAKEGFAPTEHVMQPRPKGFAAAVDQLREHVDAVYDVTIGYENGVPTLGHYIIGAVKSIHMHVRRYPIETLPEGEEALSDWLRARFLEKDRLLDQFYRDGVFPAEPFAIGA